MQEVPGNLGDTNKTGGKMKRDKSSMISRRGFLTGAATVAAGAAALGLAGCADTPNEPAEVKPDYLPETWDLECEICIVGGGAAGLAAGITAIKEEKGQPLLVEFAPEAEIGGNSRVCGQIIFIPTEVEGAITYQTGLNGGYVVEEELIRAWAENICENYDWLTDLGADLKVSTVANPEYANVRGSEFCETYVTDGVVGNAVTWNLLKEVADDLGLSYQYDTRVTELIFNPVNKEVFGVKGICNGKTLNIKASKGVVLACGGFQNNQKMIQQYYIPGYFELGFAGTPYNQGDGIIMAESVGAELWNMKAVSGNVFGSKVISKDLLAIRDPRWGSKDYIFVGPDGKRFTYEETTILTRHGFYNTEGIYTQRNIPPRSYAIFGSDCFAASELFPDTAVYSWSFLVGQAAYTNQGLVDAGLILKANTIAELAQLTGHDAATLEETITTYNEYCAAQNDRDFKRGQDFWYNYGGVAAEKEDLGELFVAVPAFDLVPLQAPYYAMPYYKQLINTQGGPKRNTKGGVVDTKGGQIPRLYAAGEMGTIYSYLYNGGGNFSEAMSSGRLAVRSIGELDPWDA
jgi:succinate dehydrogenase/fumarate reductase flavoprotein subunit